MQINLYLLEELENFTDQPIILTKNDLTVSGILLATSLPANDSILIDIHDGASDQDIITLSVTQDDLSSGLVSISVSQKAAPIDTSALIYIHGVTGKNATNISDTQLETPHTFSASSGYWIPVTGDRKVPIKAEDITDFEIIRIPEPKIEDLKIKPEPKPVPHPAADQYPHMAKLAETFGVQVYDDGSVSLRGKRYTREALMESSLMKPLFEMDSATLGSLFDIFKPKDSK